MSSWDSAGCFRFLEAEDGVLLLLGSLLVRLLQLRSFLALTSIPHPVTDPSSSSALEARPSGSLDALFWAALSGSVSPNTTYSTVRASKIFIIFTYRHFGHPLVLVSPELVRDGANDIIALKLLNIGSSFGNFLPALYPEHGEA